MSVSGDSGNFYFIFLKKLEEKIEVIIFLKFLT